MWTPPPSFRRQSGAALLVMLSLLAIGASALFLKVYDDKQSERMRRQQSQRAVTEAREALIGFALSHGRLPRPAISALDGHESEFPCENERSCTGVLPWVTLGVTGSDSWSKRLRYSVVPAFTVGPIHRKTAVADKVVVGRDSSGQLLYLYGHYACTTLRPCAPAVVFSQGRRNLGIRENGVHQPNIERGNIDEITNENATRNFVSRPSTDEMATVGGEFDDFLSWITIKTLYDAMTTAGSVE